MTINEQKLVDKLVLDKKNVERILLVIGDNYTLREILTILKENNTANLSKSDPGCYWNEIVNYNNCILDKALDMAWTKIPE